MDYEALLRELYGLERFGIKLGLDTIRELLRRMGDPQNAFPAVHVTGTNGKGSVCAFLDAIFRAAGHRVGLYTSPHLVRFNERIRVDGRMIRDEEVVGLYEDVRPIAEAMAATSATKRPTFFEVTTAMAFRHFEERQVDLAIVEAGMGGTLDATNVVRPEACAITRVGLDHTEHLGRSVERIAREKAGILKRGVPVATIDQPTLGIVRSRAEELGCPLSVVGQDVRCARLGFSLSGQDVVFHDGRSLEAHIALLGAFQVENAGIAFAAARAIGKPGRPSDDDVRQGLAAARWPGRLQVARPTPLVLVDGAHNAPAAGALADSLRELLPTQRGTFVLGILSDKDLDGFANALGPLAARVIATRPRTPRAYPPEAIEKAFEGFAPVDTVPSVPDAVTRAIRDSNQGELVVVTGSIYTAGEALELLGGWE